MKFYSTIWTCSYDENGEPHAGICQCNEKAQLEHIKNKHVLLVPDDKLLKAVEVLRQAGIIE